jgi:pyruvate, water dikinase
MDILWFKDCTYKNTHLIGGKNASLGELIRYNVSLFQAANGFAITTVFYETFIKHNNLSSQIDEIMTNLDITNIKHLNKVASQIKELIHTSTFAPNQEDILLKEFTALKEMYDNPIQLAVRSSAIAEDLPHASFAGQQDTYLNIFTFEDFKKVIIHCYASLFNGNAISYRKTNNIQKDQVKMALGVQKMVLSNLAYAGVAFSLDPQSGYRQAISINSCYGLGEGVVSGIVNPDEITVDKRGIINNCRDPIVDIKKGSKANKIIYKTEGHGTIVVNTTQEEQLSVSLTDEQIIEISKAVMFLEKYYTQIHQKEVGIDVEWAYDGIDKKLYILQVRAETIHSNKEETLQLEKYKLLEEGHLLLKGVAVGERITSGKIVCLDDIYDAENKFNEGDILVTDMTTPDWEPIMKKSAGIITNKGGKTCHAAIIARELNVNAIVGTINGTEQLNDDEIITMVCSKGETGLIYKGELRYEIEKFTINNQKKSVTDIMLNIGAPDMAFRSSLYPNSGVGLTRMEFIINNYIQIHPRALLNYPNVSKTIKSKMLPLLHKMDGKNYFIKTLARGIGKIASAFYPRKIIVRLSDFKSNEYKHLIGGEEYEPDEENPMLGWRGASRYYSSDYQEAFKLECQGIKYAREKMGMSNIIVMIPFCRTPDECEKVVNMMKDEGLERGINGLEVYLMCEIPSNVIEADNFVPFIDGVSIGGNDLLQLTLGIDRDSQMLTGIANDTNVSYRRMISQAIKTYKGYGKKVGFCGQQPSDSVEFAQFLMKEGIDSISVTPDSVLNLLSNI